MISSWIFHTCFWASLSEGKTSNILQLWGTSSNHITCTGSQPWTCLTTFQVQSFISLIFPYTSYATTESFLFNVQVTNNNVAIVHILLSFVHSRITHTPGTSGLYFNSNISACKSTYSNNSSTHSQVIDDNQTKGVFHPQSSGIRLCSETWDFTKSIFAFGLSIFVIATIILTQASLAWFIASTVCGLTQSSAATTIIAISVIFAHLALIAVKSSCQGVSIKVIFFQLWVIWLAQIPCVIPPASHATISVFLT